MKKYSILALALALCITGLTGCRRNKDMADGTIPNTTMESSAATTNPTTNPTTMATTAPTTTPATAETGPSTGTDGSNGNMTDDTNSNAKGRSGARTPGMG